MSSREVYTQRSSFKAGLRSLKKKRKKRDWVSQNTEAKRDEGVMGESRAICFSLSESSKRVGRIDSRFTHERKVLTVVFFCLFVCFYNAPIDLSVELLYINGNNAIYRILN